MTCRRTHRSKPSGSWVGSGGRAGALEVRGSRGARPLRRPSASGTRAPTCRRRSRAGGARRCRRRATARPGPRAPHGRFPLPRRRADQSAPLGGVGHHVVPGTLERGLRPDHRERALRPQRVGDEPLEVHVVLEVRVRQVDDERGRGPLEGLPQQPEGVARRLRFPGERFGQRRGERRGVGDDRRRLPAERRHLPRGRAVRHRGERREGLRDHRLGGLRAGRHVHHHERAGRRRLRAPDALRERVRERLRPRTTTSRALGAGAAGLPRGPGASLGVADADRERHDRRDHRCSQDPHDVSLPAHHATPDPIRSAPARPRTGVEVAAGRSRATRAPGNGTTPAAGRPGRRRNGAGGPTWPRAPQPARASGPPPASCSTAGP